MAAPAKQTRYRAEEVMNSAHYEVPYQDLIASDVIFFGVLWLSVFSIGTLFSLLCNG